MMFPLYFSIGENIGSEDRCTEFKEGPGFIQHNFRANISKYVSAFVNSHENGRLLLGVSDNGNFFKHQGNMLLKDLRKT